MAVRIYNTVSLLLKGEANMPDKIEAFWYLRQESINKTEIKHKSKRSIQYGKRRKIKGA